jgi:hypothetical protein
VYRCFNTPDHAGSVGLTLTYSVIPTAASALDWEIEVPPLRVEMAGVVVVVVVGDGERRGFLGGGEAIGDVGWLNEREIPS